MRGVIAAALLTLASHATAADITIDPAKLPVIGRIDSRFQSYNIEMVEVTGGRFWAPYAPTGSLASKDLHAQRPPIDLTNPRLRKLAAALGPAYLRVSGTWANATWFAGDSNATAPPPGFDGVLTSAQWRGAIDFGRAVDARLVTSFAISAGTRDAGGAWTTDQAQKLVAFTREAGGVIAAAEFMNEPDLQELGKAPKDYDAAAYARDFARFLAFIRAQSPQARVLGPGAAGQSAMSGDFARVSGPDLDVFSYHHYGTLSERCTGAPNPLDPLSRDWLARSSEAFTFHAWQRDRFAPGRPIWLTETAEAACGGNRAAATFADTFRYLDQLGRLAKAGVQVVMHNTLAASDYGLLDERDFTPRPNYWGAWLWRRLMGKVVLDAGATPPDMYVYAHCKRDGPGVVALLVISASRTASLSVKLRAGSRHFILQDDDLEQSRLRLNGAPLVLGPDDAFPSIDPGPLAPEAIALPPISITFLQIPAPDSACN